MGRFDVKRDARPNMVSLGGGFFLVRTQAGYRKAWKTFVAGADVEERRDLKPQRGFPTEYPALVNFSWFYDRGNWVVHSRVSNDLVEKLVPLMEELLGPKRPVPQPKTTQYEGGPI